jgi:ubiquinone/menaquinone biosynthesis C-methylase UbiE
MLIVKKAAMNSRLRAMVFWLFAFTGHENPWESENIVKSYYGEYRLQEPEETILKKLRAELPEMRMLDAGVGAGRTTYHFAPLAKEYVGVDISKNMIRACRRKFRNYPKRVPFEVADARNLPFKDNCFDFVLFSFNGIDSVNHEDRLKTLHEIRRVTKNGGYFCFSTHNLNHAWRFTIFRPPSKKPVNLLREVRRLFLVRLLNRKVWKTVRGKNKTRQGHLMFKDGAHNFKIKSYYVVPKEQIDQLTDSNFKHVGSYDLLGNEIKNPSELQSATDRWIYYLARAC